MASRSNPVYCAVDTVDLAQAARLIRSVAGGARPAVGGIKLGLEFFLAHGAPGVRYAFPAPVRATGVGFFLDLKLHDIPNTVAGGIRAVVELEPTFITLHTAGGPAMMAALARASGLDGVVCSPHEIAALRKACGKEFVLMVPGIRPAGSASGDQKRVMTPRQAVGLGANHLVIGRPITEAADPDSAAQAIARDLEAL
jgi:orotidine-5'-phosphate decarboxylase